MIDKIIAEALGDLALQHLDLLAVEFDDVSGFQIYEVVVMSGRHFLIAGPAVPEVMTFQDVRRLEQPHRAVNRSDADPRIERRYGLSLP